MKTIKTGLLAVIVVFGMCQAGQALNPNTAPGGNFNLTNFYLGLPVDSSGGTTGNSASVPAAQLVTGYSNALYFYTAPADGAMVFWAPVTGATTSGSSYPRSELREQISPASNSSNWLGYGTHLLAAECRVTQVPSSGKVIIGQIHGYTGAALPLVKLQYNNGTVEVLIKTNANNDLTDKKYAFLNVGLNHAIQYQIKVVNGLISVAVNGITNSLNVFQTDPDWATNTLYFKAGSYCQDNSGTTNEGARLAFYALARSHAPAIVEQPISAVAVAGSDAGFSVSAAGNGRLRYQWFFNQTNSLGGATNASLGLTNAQPQSAGTYSVRVSDSLGAVTSALVTLEIDRPPVPGNCSAVTGQGVPISTGLGELLAAASDSDGDAIEVSAVDPLSVQGGSVARSNTVVWYTPPAGLVGLDQWIYTLSDGRGAFASGLVAVTVVASNALTLRPTAQRWLEEGSFYASFEGVPGLRYSVDRASEITGPWQLGITNLTGEPSGLLEFKAPKSSAQEQEFFRVRYP